MRIGSSASVGRARFSPRCARRARSSSRCRKPPPARAAPRKSQRNFFFEVSEVALALGLRINRLVLARAAAVVVDEAGFGGFGRFVTAHFNAYLIELQAPFSGARSARAMPLPASASSASSSRARERRALGGALHLDEAPGAGHHHVHVGVAGRVLGVVEVEHRRALVRCRPRSRRRNRAAASSAIEALVLQPARARRAARRRRR